MADLDLSQAQQVLDAAMQKAAEIDTLMNVAVVDDSGNLKAFGRMDGAWLGSIDISIKKARTVFKPMPCRKVSAVDRRARPRSPRSG